LLYCQGLSPERWRGTGVFETLHRFFQVMQSIRSDVWQVRGSIKLRRTQSRRTSPMMKSAITALFLSAAALSAPAIAQEAAAPATAAPALTPEQAEAQNKAIADFTAAQQAQAAGNHAEVIAKLEPALPTIREIASRDPANVQNAGFLASALTITANSQGALGKIDAIAPLYAEAAPQWTKVYEADKANAGVRNTLVAILVNLGNFSLSKQDKAAAKPNFEQALAIAKEGRATDPASADLANAEFSSLIGLNQSTGEASYLEAAKPVGAELREKGIVSAANQPAVDAILGAA
jgi:tetratricopeptide (TPR) repeat protein